MTENEEQVQEAAESAMEAAEMTSEAPEVQQPEEDREAAMERYRPHFQELERQGAAMAERFPGFDLRKELRNPVFARLTAPGSGLGVEDAYFAVHRRELQEAAMRRSAQRTAEKLARSIQAGNLRPRESGGSQGMAVAGFDYRSATREQREALKRRIREASVRGEKVYPR